MKTLILLSLLSSPVWANTFQDNAQTFALQDQAFYTQRQTEASERSARALEYASGAASPDACSWKPYLDAQGNPQYVNDSKTHKLHQLFARVCSNDEEAH